MNEMERMLSQYQEKLDNVTSSYEEKVNILENRLVDREMEQQPQPPDGQGGETFIIKNLLCNQLEFPFFFTKNTLV